MADLRRVESPDYQQSDVSPTDAELITRWRRGDHAALETLLVRYERPIYLFVLGILRDPHRAEDALQETFYTALTRLDGVDASHFRGWLFTVAYHQAMLEKRREALARRWVSLDDDFEQLLLSAKTPEPWQELAQREQRQQVHRWLRRLPPRQQEVVRLRFLEGLRFRDIAARLGVPLGTALARLHQALKRLMRIAREAYDHSS